MKIHLIVGMDAITDTKAIEKLSDLCLKFKNFSAQAFLPCSGGIFHPKVSWVKKGKTGVVITGSGNLTKGGLKNNYEAFSVMQANQQTMKSIEDSWLTFLDKNAENLFPLDAEEVKKAAQQNALLNKSIKKIFKDAGKKATADAIPKKGSVVFIEELTKGRGGKQRDVGKWAAENYFDKGKKLFLTHINDQGQRADEETRKLSSKGSSNFAIDLAASKGLDPVNGCMPIAVFIRIRPYTFYYHIVSVDSAHYKTVSSYLNSAVIKVQQGHAKRIKKEISIDELRKKWPTAPFWRIEDE